MRSVRPAILAMLVCVVVAGCGSSAPAPRALSVAVTVPVDGATVNTPHIDVVGTVAPGAAVVRVSGRHARVHSGAFKARVSLHRGRNRIGIVADATGLPRARSMLTIVYRPGRVAPGPSMVERVNAVCDGQIGEALQFSLANTTAAALGKLSQAVALEGTDLNQLASIHPPAGEAAAYDGFVAARRQIFSRSQMLIGAAQAHSVTEVRQAMVGWVPLVEHERSLANQLDFTQCDL